MSGVNLFSAQAVAWLPPESLGAFPAA